MKHRISFCVIGIAVVLTTALSLSSLRADDGLSRQDDSASASQAYFTNVNASKEDRGQALDRREPLTFSPSIYQRAEFIGEASSLRIDREIEIDIDNSPYIYKPQKEVRCSSAFYLQIKDAFFVLSVIHGIVQQDEITLTPIERLSLVTAKGERLAFDNGFGSKARRLTLERKNLVDKATRYVKLAGRPFLLAKEDVVVFKLEKPLAGGFVPLLPGDYNSLKVDDPLTALTANGSAIGTTRSCRAAELKHIDENGFSRLRFLSNNPVGKDLIRQGDSGAPILDSRMRVIGVLLQVKNTGSQLWDGRIISDDALAVDVNRVVALISEHWNL